MIHEVGAVYGGKVISVGLGGRESLRSVQHPCSCSSNEMFLLCSLTCYLTSPCVALRFFVLQTGADAASSESGLHCEVWWCLGIAAKTHPQFPEALMNARNKHT
jgi:hypothetical protein